MIIKWAISGAIIGVVVGLYSDENVGSMAVFGGSLAVVIRKWILRNFWM